MMKLAESIGLPEPQLVAQLNRSRVLVVGDVMLDRYWFGDTHRISPEAPVPVAKIERMEQRAGGAANVARNIASLGGQAALLSVTGDDEAAASLAQLMAEVGVESHLMKDAAIATTIAIRTPRKTCIRRVTDSGAATWAGS